MKTIASVKELPEKPMRLILMNTEEAKKEFVKNNKAYLYIIKSNEKKCYIFVEEAENGKSKNI